MRKRRPEIAESEGGMGPENLFESKKRMSEIER